jgi:sulfatase maturation enzyme AslB (radical SAM superfamily)
LSRYALYPSTKKHRMSDETLELLIKSYIETQQPNYVFCWQGR